MQLIKTARITEKLIRRTVFLFGEAMANLMKKIFVLLKKA